MASLDEDGANPTVIPTTLIQVVGITVGYSTDYTYILIYAKCGMLLRYWGGMIYYMIAVPVMYTVLY